MLYSELVKRMEPQKTIPQTNGSATPSQANPVPLSSHLPQNPPEKPKREGLNSVLSTLGILIAAPIIALALTLFVFQSYEVDGPSMETTLQNRDRLLVLKVHKTIARITNRDYIPSRGEIIIFNTAAIHEENTVGEQKQLIKRVIGVPGDRVVVNDGVITVYNNEFPEGFNPDKIEDHGEESLVTPGSVDVTVKPGEVFVCGDNRTNSLDSRSIGTIPADDIIGKLLLRIYPLSNAEAF